MTNLERQALMNKLPNEARQLVKDIWWKVNEAEQLIEGGLLTDEQTRVFYSLIMEWIMDVAPVPEEER